MILEKNYLATCGAREASYHVLLAAFQGNAFISDGLEGWQRQAHPSDLDFRFAQELSYGAMRMARALDYVAAKFTDKQKLSLKLREKVILRMAIYQTFWMSRVPAYAAVHESVSLARKHCHPSFISFLNAILRRISETTLHLPDGDTPEEISIRFSYPKLFVENLLQEHPLPSVKEILQAMNEVAPIMVRIRSKGMTSNPELASLEIISQQPLIGVLRDTGILRQILQSPDVYIQNSTPATLIAHLAKNWNKRPPKRILDLCASPGGKLIAVQEYFPEAELFANDISSEKIKLLTENCAKYGISAKITCSRGEDYQGHGLFDLIILDVPCSNSGVFNKRAEARWRLTESDLKKLEEIQMKLLLHARGLLSETGEIWYMTCSILKQENEGLAQSVCEQTNLSIQWQECFLPNSEGWDGGYACILTKS
jgi:16S rRNA (cytosine967-C5)-methyltransferase